VLSTYVYPYMRTTKTYSITMPPEMAKQLERLARKENRTISELVREALRQYQQKQEAAVNTELLTALRDVQEAAKRAGVDKMSKRHINAEIAGYRRERAKRIKQPVR